MVPSQRPLFIGNWSAQDWNRLSSREGRLSVMGHLFSLLHSGTHSVLTLEPAPLDEINNMFEAPEMLGSLAEK